MSFRTPTSLAMVPLRVDWLAFGVCRLEQIPSEEHAIMGATGGRLWSWAYLRGAELDTVEIRARRVAIVQFQNMAIIPTEEFLRWAAALKMMAFYDRKLFWDALAHSQGFLVEQAASVDFALHMLMEAWRQERLGFATGAWMDFCALCRQIVLPDDFSPYVGYYASAYSEAFDPRYDLNAAIKAKGRA